MADELTGVYLYDGSYDGLLTAVFEAYARKEFPEALAEEENLQVTFGQKVVRIGSDDEKARRVEKGVRKKMGELAWQNIWKAYLSSEQDKGTVVYRYIRRGMEVGRNIYNDLAHPAVLAMEKLTNLVGKESHYYIEFLRFSQMEGGVYYAKISPENFVVPLMMPHFVDRYSVQPFLIHDDVHHVAGVFDMHGWQMVETHDLTLPDETYEELQYKRLWKRFYETIAIRERYNARCRQGHLPKKYWKNMNEFTFVETAKTRARDQAEQKKKPPLQEADRKLVLP